MQPDPRLQRLLLLTLNLEEAIKREAFGEIDSLFRQRDLALDQVAPLGIPKTHPTVKELLDADARIGLLLATRSRESAEAIRKVRSQERAQRAYSQAA